MALSRTRMPSFTLVLTSNWHTLHGYPTAIKFDPCASYTMLPVMIDHLLVTYPMFFSGNHDDDSNLYVLQPTIDLVGGPADNQVHIHQLVSWVSPDGLSMSSHFMLRIRPRTKSLHLSEVRKKRLLRLPRSVHLNFNACPFFNMFLAMCIDSYSFPKKEVV